jgi:hypothetical protein
MSVITVSPQRRRLGLYWEIHGHNVHAGDVVRFLRDFHRQATRRMVLILDRWQVHKAAAMREFLQRHPRSIRVEWLPPYAPELNPVEQVWNHTKYSDLPNLAPDDIGQLHGLVYRSIKRQRSQSGLLRSFFQTAKLKL